MMHSKSCEHSSPPARYVLSIIGLAILLAAGFVAAEEDPFRVVFIAYQNPNQLIEDVEPFVEYLEQRLDELDQRLPHTRHNKGNRHRNCPQLTAS